MASQDNIHGMQTGNNGVFTRKILKFDHKGRERIVNQHVFTYTTPTQIGFRPGEAGFLYISQVGEEWLLDKQAGEQ